MVDGAQCSAKSVFDEEYFRDRGFEMLKNPGG